MIIKPIRDKKTGKVINNVDLCKRCYKELKKLQDGKPTDSEKARLDKRVLLDKITGGHTEEVMSWLEKIATTEDERLAQSLIASTLIAPPTINRE